MNDMNAIPLHHHLAKWAGIFLLIAVPLAYAHNGHDIILYIKLLVTQMGTLFMTVAWLIGTSRGDIPHKRYSLDLPFLLFLLINILSWTILSINPFKSGLVVIKVFTFVTLYFAITRTFHTSFLKPWIYVIAIVTAVVSVIGICQYFAIGFLWLRTTGLPSATFGLRNLAGMYLIGAIPIASLPFLWSSTIRSEIIWGFIFTLPVIFLIYTRTRGAWVGLCIALIFSGLIFLVYKKEKWYKLYFLYKNPDTAIPRSSHHINKSKYYIATAYLIFIGFMATCPTILPKHTNPNYAIPPTKATVSQVAHSIIQSQDNPRFILWKHTIRMIQDHWIYGVGVGNWDLIFPLYERGEHTRPDYYARRPHNDAMWIASELGILGIVFFLFICSKSLFFAFGEMGYSMHTPIQPNSPVTIPSIKDTEYQTISIIFGISLLAISGHACFSFPYERISPLLFWCIITSIVSTMHTQHTTSKIASRYLTSLPVLSILCLILGIVFTLRSIETDRQHYALTRHFMQNNWSDVIRIADQALQYGVIDHWILLRKAEAQHRQGNTQQAIKTYKTSLTYYPYEKTAYWKIGLLEQTEGNLEQAQMALEYAVFLDSDNAGFHQDLGAVYQLQGKFQNAHQLYQEALALGTEDPLIQMNLGRIYETWNMPQKAAQAYRTFLERWQGDDTTADLIRKQLHQLE